LDIDVPSFGEDFALLYQDFEHNVYQGLSEAQNLIAKYQTLSLVLSSKSFQYTPLGLLMGSRNIVSKIKYLLKSFQI
jgi:hypothetical protein